MPSTIEPRLDIETDNEFPVRLRFTILNGWVDGDGEWEFTKQIVLPAGERPAELYGVARFHFIDHEDLFLDMVRIDWVFRVPGTHWVELGCGGNPVASYPLRIYPRPAPTST